MNQQQSGGTAVLDRPQTQARSQPKTPVPTRKDLYAAAVNSLLSNATTVFKALPDLEGRPLDEVRAASTTGNVFEPIVGALNAAGHRTEVNVGSVMDATGMDHADVHDLACECRSATITGEVAAGRMRTIAARHTDD